MLVRVSIALLATATAALAAPAATPAPNREALRQYCTGDYLSYCSDYAADSPEVKACFKQNKAKLSPDCRAAIASYSKAQKRG